MHNLKYRNDIDVLRAISIVLVALFHFQIHQESIIKNGFVGVDIFFVISGFLILPILSKIENIKDLGIFLSRRIFRKQQYFLRLNRPAFLFQEQGL